MKKNKKIVVLLLIMFIFSLASVVDAHSVELDPDSIISFPEIIHNGEGKIKIAASVTDYELSYQAVEIPEETYNQIETIATDGKKLLGEIQTELKTLNTQSKELETICNDAKDKLDSLIEQGIEGTELEEAQKAYDTAKANYDAKLEEIQTKTLEYNNKATEITNNVKELIPTYDDSAWKISEDGNFKIDTSNFSGEKVYVLWAKLVKSDDTIVYDEILYTTEGSLEEEILVTSIELDKSELTLSEGSSYTLKATIKPDNATDKTLTWTSDNEEVATVDENGKVTAVSEGTATITARTANGEIEDTCEVTVTERIVINDPDGNDDENDAGSIYDDSIAEGKIPQTGKSYIVLSFIAILAVFSIIIYIKMRKNNFK